MKQNKKIIHVTWNNYNTRISDRTGWPASSLPIRDRLLKSIAERIPFNSPNSTTATSLDWYGDYYVVYHDLYPIAVGRKGMYPFMFRPPWRGEDWGDKKSREMKFLSRSFSKRCLYYDTGSATRLSDLFVYLGFHKTCVGRKLNEKTKRMNNVYESCPVCSPYGCHDIFPRDRYVTDECASDAKRRNKLVENGVVVIDGDSDDFKAYCEGQMKDVVKLNHDYRYREVALLETPCTWYHVIDGQPIPMKEIPEILFKALATDRSQTRRANGTATTPFNCLSRRDPMKTAQPKSVIDDITRRFDNIYTVYSLKQFICCFSKAAERDVSTKFYHPQAIRNDGSLAVADILDHYYNLDANITCTASIQVPLCDQKLVEFYHNFKRLVPILEYLCSDPGLKKQDEQGLSELEVYDFKYHFNADKDIAKVPLDFHLTLKLDQTSMKFRFSTDFSEVLHVGDNDEVLETITHGRFIDWIHEHFTAVRKATTFDFDEI